MPWPQTGATKYHAQLGLPDTGRAIKVLVVCYNWDLEPLDLLNGLTLGCNQPSNEVLIVRLVILMEQLNSCSLECVLSQLGHLSVTVPILSIWAF